MPAGPGGIALDSREVRARFGLPEFTGQLFIHAIGAAGHDVVKYALDTYAPRQRRQPLLHPRRQRLAVRPLCRPARAAAGRAGGAVGAEQPRLADPGRRHGARPHGRRAAGHAGRARSAPSPAAALDVAELLPGLALAGADRVARRPPCRAAALRGDARAAARASRMSMSSAPISRPTRTSRRSANAARPRLSAAVAGAAARPLSHASCSRRRWPRRRPTCRCGSTCSIRDGRKVAEHFLGCLPRDHDLALDLDDLLPAGRCSPRAGMPSWSMISATAAAPMAGCTRSCATRTAPSGHVAETSFGAHIFNTLDDLSRRAAILFRPAARPLDRACSSSSATRSRAQLRGPDLSGLGALACALARRRCCCMTAREMIAETRLAHRLLRVGAGVGRTGCSATTCSTRRARAATCSSATRPAACSAITA